MKINNNKKAMKEVSVSVLNHFLRLSHFLRTIPHTIPHVNNRRIVAGITNHQPKKEKYISNNSIVTLLY